MQVAINFDLTLLFMCLVRWCSFTQLLQFVGFFHKTILTAFSTQNMIAFT